MPIVEQAGVAGAMRAVALAATQSEARLDRTAAMLLTMMVIAPL